MAGEEEKKEKDEKAAEAAPPNQGLNLKLIIIIAVAVLVIGGGAAYFFLLRTPSAPEAEKAPAGEEKKADEKAPAGEEKKADEKAGAIETGTATGTTTPRVAGGLIFPLEHFIVNVNDEGGVTRYLKIEIKLELENESMQVEVDNRVPKIRDGIVTILTNKKVGEISDTNGKLRLKEEIRARINSFLTLGKVTDVYFTDFIIQ